MEVLISLPGYTDELTAEMERHDLLVHSFPLSEDQSIYSPMDYIYNRRINEFEYKLVIDTNILHFLFRSTQGKTNEKTKSAIGLIAFCQLSEIDIDPALALYEIINYDQARADEAVDKLHLFDRINNSDNRQLVEYSLGRRDSFDLANVSPRNKDKMKTNLIKYRRLLEWDSHYLIILAIVKIDQSNLSNKEKLLEFSEWMYRKFHLSAMAMSYCVIYFGRNPIKKMMKYKANGTVQEKLNALENMTWDLFIMTRFLRTWIGNESNDNFLFGSDDRAFRSIVRLSINIQIARDSSPYSKYLSDDAYIDVKYLFENGVPDNERMYLLDDDPVGYRSNLITEYKSALDLN